ncbi:conserved exported hypothetical protein [metagenome]|uniref:Uncharacterized protein n=1 Tax=metagenome TaxID=256318 RepID=A0A2P2CAW9_9ZZZZ
MKNNIPVIYWTFRTAWTLLHFIIVAAAAVALLAWAVTDNHAVRAFEPARDNVLDLQERVSNAIPWPWAVDDDGGVDNSQPENSPGRNAQSRSTTTIQVIGNVNVRSAPRVNAKVVKVLDDGSRVESDCMVKGAVVDPGPYQTKLRQYRGVDNAPTSRWDHVPGLGFVSDAYVLTVTDGLPRCR